MYKFVFSLVTSLWLQQSACQSDTIPVKGYTLVWSDEFDGNSLNTQKWDYRQLGLRNDAYNSKNAVWLDGQGHLIIEVSRRNDSVFTGMISTEKTFHTRYGYFECRVKLQTVPGTISAFWLQSPTINELNSNPQKNGVELDIFEYYAHSFTDQVAHSLHWGGYQATHHLEGPVWGKMANTSDSFHTIGFEWTENSYTTFVDGKKTYSGNSSISKVPEFLVLSVAVTQQAAGPLAITALPCRFTVDYVRVYKRKAGNPQ